MRTTLRIDDDVLSAARALAAQTGKSLGQAVSELARRSLPRRLEIDEIEEKDGLPKFRVAANARPFTDEDVKKALGDWP